MDQNEQAARASEKAAKQFAEGTSRVKDAAARASDQAIRAGAEMFQRNAETVQRTIQSSAKLASTMAENSADQFGRAFDFAGGGLTERSSRNVEAVVQSGTIMAEMMQRMCVECGDIARGRIERSFKRMGALVQCRTPEDIVAEVLAGRVRVPAFQRGLRWRWEDVKRLFDSIVKGYPIGTFILWKTNERLRSIRNLGGVPLPDTPAGDAVKYILDGQQRLTSLFVTLKGLTIERDGQQDRKRDGPAFVQRGKDEEHQQHR